MPRLSPARRQGRYDMLLDAAGSVFAAKGFDEASVSDIARRAGVSDGLLYRYFDDKRALLNAVLDRMFSGSVQRAEEALAPTDGILRRLERLIEVQLSVFEEEPELCQLYIREMRSKTSFRNSHAYQTTTRYTALIEQMVTDAIVAGEVSCDTDAHLLRDMLFGSIEHTTLHHSVGGTSIDVPVKSKAIARLLINGIVGHR